MKRLGFYIVLLLGAILQGCGSSTSDQTENDLVALDEEVANRQQYVNLKLSQIEELKKLLPSAASPVERYAGYKRIYDEYLRFNPDSARRYVELCQDIAERYQMKDEWLQSQIDDAMITILQGDYYHAKEKLDSIADIETLPAHLQHKAATAFIEFYSRRSALKSGYGGGVPVNEAKAYWGIYGKYLTKDHWQTDYYESLMTDHDKRKALYSHIEKFADNPGISAMLEYALGLGYFREGNKEEGVHHTILSAENDIRSANREAQSLVYLTNKGIPDLDADRAYRYIMVCTENARYYHDMGRSSSIIAAHASVTDNFANRLQSKSQFLTVIVVLLAISFIAIVWLLVKVQRKRKEEARLLKEKEELNSKLALMVEQDKILQKDLLNTNRELQQHISTRNQTFLNVYLLVMKYVHNVQTFKRDIHNWLTVGKIEKAKREAASSSGLEKYLKEFYAQFDKAFLTAHPDFVEKFNGLLRDDCRITPPDAESLTPELRIYALVSLGMTDSLSIAEFLNYSPQTIYNYRLKIRKCACIPEKDFANTVAHFYT